MPIHPMRQAEQEKGGHTMVGLDHGADDTLGVWQLSRLVILQRMDPPTLDSQVANDEVRGRFCRKQVRAQELEIIRGRAQ